jgi:hypothetical protein
MRRPLACLVAVVQLSSFALAGAAFAVSGDALRCQQAIGEAGREFAVARLRVLVAGNNATAAGRSCGPERRARVIGRAADAIARTTENACRGVALETLHFPGDVCRELDGNGGGFEWADLLFCLEQAHTDVTNDALGFEYPNLRTFFGKERRCQRGLARAASAFVATDMRVRTRCLDARLQGALPHSVDCLADVAPYGPGTGDAATDDAIGKAIVRLTSRISEACVGADLALMGFPGRCQDGGALDLVYVERCMRAQHARLSRLMLGVEYPSAASPTPTPAGSPEPTATPVPEYLLIAPKTVVKPVGGVQNFTIVAHMSDGNDRNFTQRVHYSSSDESVAVCPNEDGNRSRTLLVGPGTALITATEPVTGIISDAATLTVAGCLHSKCVTGVALAAKCDSCVATICAAEPSCCADAWGQSCVDAVASLCAETCPASAVGG